MSATRNNNMEHPPVVEREVDEEEKCFLIQPLDDNFRNRCDEHFKPAVEAAGLLPYRVDEHYAPRQLLKINTIYEEIQKASVCLADITMNNPNVWYEFGFADGKKIPVVLVCDEKAREKLPFDVNQRDVYFYRSDSNADNAWPNQRKEITKRIRAAVEEDVRQKRELDQLPEISAQLIDFQEERIKKIKSQELLGGAPTVAFHIVPPLGFSKKEQINLEKTPSHELQEPVSGHQRNNVDGICWHNQEEQQREYAQLFQKTGAMEYVWTFRIPDSAPSQSQRALPSAQIMRNLIRVLYRYTENLRILNFGAPPWELFLGLSLLNVEGCFFAPKPMTITFNQVPADRPDLILHLDRGRISSEKDAVEILYPLLNDLWRAFNYEKCPYDESELKRVAGLT